jgi:hypothetical protein
MTQIELPSHRWAESHIFNEMGKQASRIPSTAKSPLVIGLSNGNSTARQPWNKSCLL